MNPSPRSPKNKEGISEQTLRNWRDKARQEGYAAPGKDAVPDDWSTKDKFLIVVETASMNEAELAEYARKKGLYVEQIKASQNSPVSCPPDGVSPLKSCPLDGEGIKYWCPIYWVQFNALFDKR